jgi:predicted dehydrogenase
MANRLSSLRVGIVGTGFMGVAHTEALRRLGIPVVGIVGSTPARAREKADTANLPEVYDSLEVLLSDGAVDAVHITSPNHLHYPQVKAVLAAGRHVICEKPLALTSAETTELLGLARASGLVHATCFNQRFYPLVHQAHTMVAHGDLGPVRLVSGGYLQDWLLLDTDWNWRLEGDKGGQLRAIADIGSHWFDNIQFVTGEQITEVFADLHTFITIRQRPVGEVETFSAHGVGDVARTETAMHTDDAAGLLLRFASGARGVGTISQVSAGRKNAMSWEIDGAESSIAWCQENPEDLWIGHRGRPNEVLKRDPSLMHPIAAATAAYPAGHVEGYPDTFRSLFAAIYGDVLEGRPAGTPNYPTFADGDEAVRICEAVAKSATTGTWAHVLR